MANAAATTAYSLLRRNQPRWEWLSKSVAQIAAEAEHRQMFWLRIAAPNATLRPAIFRLPSREYPLLIVGAAVNRPVASFKLYCADDETTTYSVPIETVAGGSDSHRQRFQWEQPLLVLPRTAWRIELNLVDVSGLTQNTVLIFRCVRIK